MTAPLTGRKLLTKTRKTFRAIKQVQKRVKGSPYLLRHCFGKIGNAAGFGIAIQARLVSDAAAGFDADELKKSNFLGAKYLASLRK